MRQFIYYSVHFCLPNGSHAARFSLLGRLTDIQGRAHDPFWVEDGDRNDDDNNSGGGNKGGIIMAMAIMIRSDRNPWAGSKFDCGGLKVETTVKLRDRSQRHLACFELAVPSIT